MPSLMASDRSPETNRALVYALCAAPLYIGGNVLVWAGRHHLHLGTEVQVRLNYIVFAVFVFTFVATAVLVALCTRERALLVATMAATASVTVANLLLIPLGVFWLPGLYHIDYELRLFVVERILGALFFSLYVALAASGVAACALALRRRISTQGL